MTQMTLRTIPSPRRASWAALVVVTLAVVAAGALAEEPTAAATPPPETPAEAPFFDGTIDIGPMDTLCEATSDWLDYEAAVGDSETHQLNQPKVTPEGVEAKVRGWRRRPNEPVPRSNATILCLTYTYIKKHDQAAVLHNTWGALCDRHVVVTNQNAVSGVDAADVVTLEARGGEHNDNLWLKTTAILEVLATRPDLNNFDYYFIGGDDVMMVPSNLRRVVSEPNTRFLHDSGTPLFFGTRFVFMPGDSVEVDLNNFKEIENLGTWGRQTEFLSGSGYVLNKFAIHVVYHGLANQQQHCNPNMRTHAEDVYIAYCLQHYGIFPRDARDAQGEDRVQVMTPYHMATQSANTAYTWWFRDYKPVPTPMGAEITSKHSFVWHYMGSNDVKKMTKMYEGA